MIKPLRNSVRMHTCVREGNAMFLPNVDGVVFMAASIELSTARLTNLIANHSSRMAGVGSSALLRESRLILLPLLIFSFIYLVLYTLSYNDV